MIKLGCPICENEIEVKNSAREGKRITCPHCFAQLALFKDKSRFILACAMCKEPVFDPTLCGECERRRDKKSLLEEGRL